MTAVYPLAEMVSTHLTTSKMIIGKKPVNPEHFTRTSHVITDDWMAHLTGNQYKVLALIDRYTTGYNRDTCKFSIAEIMRATGIKSDTTVTECVRVLVKLGIVSRGFVTTGAVIDTSEYWINFGVRLGGVVKPVQVRVPAPASFASDPMALPAFTLPQNFPDSLEKVDPTPPKISGTPPPKNDPLSNKGLNTSTKKQQTKPVAKAVPSIKPVPVIEPRVVVSECIKQSLGQDTIPDAAPSPQTVKEAPSTRTETTTTTKDADAIAAACRLVGLSESQVKGVIRHFGADEVLRQAVNWKRNTDGKTIPNRAGYFHALCRDKANPPQDPDDTQTSAQPDVARYNMDSYLFTGLEESRRIQRELRAQGKDIQVKRRSWDERMVDIDLDA